MDEDSNGLIAAMIIGLFIIASLLIIVTGDKPIPLGPF